MEKVGADNWVDFVNIMKYRPGGQEIIDGLADADEDINTQKLPENQLSYHAEIRGHHRDQNEIPLKYQNNLRAKPKPTNKI